MARISPSLRNGRLFSTTGCGSIPGTRIVSPRLKVDLPSLALRIASSYSATVINEDSVKCFRARKTAVVTALAVSLMVPGGSAGDASGLAAGVGLCAAETCVCDKSCPCRTKTRIAMRSTSVEITTEERSLNFFGGIRFASQWQTDHNIQKML